MHNCKLKVNHWICFGVTVYSQQKRKTKLYTLKTPLRGTCRSCILPVCYIQKRLLLRVTRRPTVISIKSGGVLQRDTSIVFHSSDHFHYLSRRHSLEIGIHPWGYWNPVGVLIAMLILSYKSRSHPLRQTEERIVVRSPKTPSTVPTMDTIAPTKRFTNAPLTRAIGVS